jgi:O-antigen/teichoic acid export membrane protein
MELIRSGIRVLASRSGQVAANALVVFLVADRLGPAGQGRYSLAIAVAMFLAAVLNGGVGLAAVPPLRSGDIAPLRMVRAQMFWIGWSVAAAALVVATLMAARVVPVELRQLATDTAIVGPVVVAIVAYLAFDLANYDLLAAGHVVLGAGVNLLRALGHLGAVAVLAAAGRLDLTGALAAWAAAQLAAAAYLGRRVLGVAARPDAWGAAPTDEADAPVPEFSAAATAPRENDRYWHRAAASPPRLALLALRRGWLGQLSAVLYIVLLRLDQAWLELAHGVVEVGVYSVAVWAGEILWLLPGALTPLLVHSSAGVVHVHERDRTAARAVRLGLGVTAAAALPLVAGAAVIFPRLANGGFAESVPALWALLPGIVAFAPGAVLAGDFIGRGRPAWNAQASVVALAVNILACALLIPSAGAVGAAAASSLAYAIGSFVMLARFVAVTGLPWRDVLVPTIRDLRG